MLFLSHEWDNDNIKTLIKNVQCSKYLFNNKRAEIKHVNIGLDDQQRLSYGWLRPESSYGIGAPSFKMSEEQGKRSPVHSIYLLILNKFRFFLFASLIFGLDILVLAPLYLGAREHMHTTANSPSYPSDTQYKERKVCVETFRKVIKDEFQESCWLCCKIIMTQQ